ncbi:GAF domain-containing protein [Motilibacter rhizosphaerae]|uniref:GAF domain-containing protein n=1 Tax=Motilibacter rhizosphaerae TaxID=598652 RepID=A0A4V2F4L9_9ACTN|nr:GAF domain-containing protein [Motilibacter rhizosphaerae]RZS89779.1 GAF domain-containing protein [Motilibacter rhizosphaerae]
MNPVIANDPVTDAERLQEVGSYDLYSDEVRAQLDAFARAAAARFDLPIGLVSIVLDEAQYLAGTSGVEGWIDEADGTPVEWSFCVNAVRNRAPYVVPDATVDPLQHDNPLVTDDGIRSYAGAPLVTSSGHVLGSYCVIGTTPRDFTAEEVAELTRMADEVVAAIEQHRDA